MICVFFIFCSVIVSGDVPLHEGAVSRYEVPGGIVLLAHNDLDGQYFAQIRRGDMVRYFDGAWSDYRVTDVVGTQALEPHSPFTSLQVGNSTYTPWEIHRMVYDQDLVLQTCIYKDGDWSWGRLFVIAEAL